MLNPPVTDDREFFEAYDRLRRDGECDNPGSAECERVLNEWQLYGQPADIEGFIRLRANVGPGEVEHA